MEQVLMPVLNHHGLVVEYYWNLYGTNANACNNVIYFVWHCSATIFILLMNHNISLCIVEQRNQIFVAS